MPKVILICGKICCGKSTYAEKIRTANKAVLLSVDEIMLAVFGQHAGDKHDEYCENLQKYLFEKSLEIIKIGRDVILDWGFWQKEKRDFAKEFYRRRGYPASCIISTSAAMSGGSVWRKEIPQFPRGKQTLIMLTKTLRKNLIRFSSRRTRTKLTSL